MRSSSRQPLGGLNRDPMAISKRQIKRVKRCVEVPGSGNQPMRKGDLEIRSWKVEAKSSSKESISLKREWIEKICIEALQEGMDPAMILTVETVRAPGERDWF